MTEAVKHNVNEVKSQSHWDQINASPHQLSLLMFWAKWHQPSVELKDGVFAELSRKFPHISYLAIEAEEIPEVSIKFEIESVPTFIMLRNGKLVDKFEGSNVPSLTAMVQKYPKTYETSLVINAPHASSEEILNKRLAILVNSQPMMIFIKGTPQDPQCGFSRQLVDLLNNLKCQYGSFNILADESVRQGLKEFSNWPTYPQLYIKGELIGLSYFLN